MFPTGAWDDGAGAAPSGYIVCLTRPLDECLACINQCRCGELSSGSCERECGPIESPRPTRPIPIKGGNDP
jgi:hypothetical protein